MIHILIRYLGIKTKLIDEIKKTIISETTDQDVFLDLFAGSNIVAESLMHERTVYTNDIQKYSYIVAKALFENIDVKLLCNLSLKKIVDSIYFKENFQYLYELLETPAFAEKEMLNSCKSVFEKNKFMNEECIKRFKFFYENEPYVGHFNDAIKEFQGLESFYSYESYWADKKNKNNSFYTLFSKLFAMPYFSLNQAIFIDSYRYSIDKLYLLNKINEKEYAIYLSLLIYLLQNIVTSVGDHFAQPQKFKLVDEPKYEKEIIKIINKKNLCLEKCIEDKLEEFRHSQPIEANHRCFNLDAIALLNDDSIMEKVSIIYMDPPYTNAHYSRFYHILETLVKYDYPEFSFNARYPINRHQSPFCIKSKAKKTFEEMISICSKKNKKLLISYSDTKQCIIMKNELIEICEKYYKCVEVVQIDYLYRNFGQKPNKVKGNELLIVCR